jgi:hypothetical protein
MTVWFKDPIELFNKSKVLQFWPSAAQTGGERINSATRFIMYLSTVLYIVNRDPRVFVLAAMVIGTMYVLYSMGHIKEAHPVGKPTADCQYPTASNPMANVLLSDYTDNPNRPPACYHPTVSAEVSSLLDDTFPYDSGRSRSPLPKYQTKFGARQFFSHPASMIPGDQTGFAEFCYGKKFRPMCRDTPGQCDPNYWGAQPEAFAGLDPSGDKRSGMSGGTI